MDNVTLIRITAGLLLIVVALFTARDAKKRGMNALFWFFAVLFFEIVALLVYFAVRKPLLSEARPVSLPSGLPSLCPHCGKYYRGRAKYCPLCGNPQFGESTAVFSQR